MTDLRGKRLSRTCVALSVAWSAAALLAVLHFTWPFEMLDHRIYDLKLSFRADATQNPSIVHVDIDDPAIQAMGPWPWDRALSARIVRRLTELGAKAIVFDILFSTNGKSAEGDEEFVNCIQQSGKVVAAVSPMQMGLRVDRVWVDADRSRVDLLYERAWPLSQPKCFQFFRVAELRNSGLALPQVMKAGKFLGHIKAAPDRDRVFRRMPLVIQLADRVIPSLSLAALATYLQLDPEQIRLTDRGNIEIGHPKALFTIPVDSRANLLIRWRPTWDSFAHKSVLDLFQDDQDPARATRYKDKIVIVAVAWTGTTDIGTNPLEHEFFLSRVHSAVLDTILSGRFLHAVEPFPFLVLCAVLFSVFFGLTAAKLSLRSQIAVFAVIVTLAVAVVLIAFFGFSLEIPMAGSFFIFIPSSVLVMSFRAYANDREREQIRNTFGRYVSDEVVEEILNSDTGINVKGELKEVTFLVSDLRGFTPMTESLPPMVTVEIANRYLEKMTAVIVRHRGTINEFMGDGILVFFGVPRGDPDHPRNAVACALDMQAAMVDLNREQRRLGLPELAMGIGINTGIAVVGTIGSEKRKKYTAMGSAINVTFRVEGQTKGGEVLVTPTVHQRLERDLEIGGMREAQLKGIALPLTLYSIVGLKEGEYREENGDSPKN